MVVNNYTYWEKIAQTNWGLYTSNIAKKAILKADCISKKRFIGLDFGCEGGRWAKLLTDLGWKMICADVDLNSLKLCKNRLPTSNCVLVSKLSNSMPIASESIDLLLCLEVAPVINSDWFTKEAYRVLKEEGVIIAVFWNLLSFRGLFHYLKSKINGKYDYYKHIYPIWKHQFSKLGFKIVEEVGYCWFPFSRSSNSSLINFFIKFEERCGLRKLSSISPWVIFIGKKC